MRKALFTSCGGNKIDGDIPLCGNTSTLSCRGNCDVAISNISHLVELVDGAASTFCKPVVQS